MEYLVKQIILILLCGGVIYIVPLEKNRKDVFFLLVSFISMLYMHSMVSPQSMPDLPVYKDVFDSVRILRDWNAILNHWAHEGFGYNMEIGYLYLNWVIGQLTSSFTVYLWIYSFVMLYAYFKTIKQYSPYIYVSILILLLMPYGQSLFVIRQHMAMALLFSSIPFIIERRFISFLLVISFIFFSFHHSCLVFFPLYFLYGFNGKRLILALIISMVLIASFWSFLSLISLYLNYETFAMESSSELSNVTTFIQMLLFLILYVCALGKKVLENGINKVCLCALILSVFLNGMSMGLNLGRLTMYYNIFAILSIPLSLTYIRKIQIRYMIGFCVIILLIIQTVYGSNSQYFEDMQFVSLF